MNPSQRSYTCMLLVLVACFTCMPTTTAQLDDVAALTADLMHMSPDAEDSGTFRTLEHSPRALMGDHHEHDHVSSASDHVHSTSTEDEHDHDHVDGADAHAHDHPSAGPENSHHDHVHDHEHDTPPTAAVAAPGASAEVDKTVVKTAEELQAAVKRGDVHIEIQDHLDLTDLEMQDCEGKSCILGLVPSTVKSIRVRTTLASSACFPLFLCVI